MTAAVIVRGVAAPGRASLGGDSGGGVVVVAQRLGDDGGWGLEDELAQRGGPAGLARARRGSLAVLVLVVVEYGIGMYVNLYVTIPRADHGHGLRSVIANGPAMLSIHAVIGLLLGLGAARRARASGPSPPPGLVNGRPVSGLVSGLDGGLGFGFSVGAAKGGIACIRYWGLRMALALTRRTPWRYVRFLEYATDRILLRRVGGGYEFIHPLLLEYFAMERPERSRQRIDRPARQRRRAHSKSASRAESMPKAER
jgi:hypothetical protein